MIEGKHLTLNIIEIYFMKGVYLVLFIDYYDGIYESFSVRKNLNEVGEHEELLTNSVEIKK